MSENEYMTFDIPEWVNWLARDSNGALYGYRAKPMKCSTVFGASEAYTAGSPNLQFITEDPNHYPQVKWSDEEPHFYRNGGTFYDVDVDALVDAYTKMEQSTEDVEVELQTHQDTPEPDMIQNDTPDMVNTPPHYKQYSFEPIDIITEVVKEYPPEIGFHIGTTLKYLFRSPFKGNLPQDLEKAGYYLQRANKELEETK